MLNVWHGGVDTIYGIPSGNYYDALAEDKDGPPCKFATKKQVLFGQRRCKPNSAAQSGCAGSGGPGATWLTVLRCSYDTHSLLVLGSRPVNELNMDAFQELNQKPNVRYRCLQQTCSLRWAPSQKYRHLLLPCQKPKRSSCAEIPANLVSKKSTKTRYYGSGSWRTLIHRSCLERSWNWQSVEIWTMPTPSYSPLVGVLSWWSDYWIVT